MGPGQCPEAAQVSVGINAVFPHVGLQSVLAVGRENSFQGVCVRFASQSPRPWSPEVDSPLKMSSRSLEGKAWVNAGAWVCASVPGA